MGYWTCDDFPGEKYYDKDDIRNELDDELWDWADSEFFSWLDENYNVSTLWCAFKDGSDYLDIFHECMDSIWEREDNLYKREDGTMLDHDFVWHDEESRNRKPVKRRS